MKKRALTLTVAANMTANYSENLGNIASVQKVYKNRKTYTIRSRESLKNALMVQSGMYDDLQTEVDGATQKLVNEELNASNCQALEGGYMSTSGTTYIRKSSFYMTDAISCESFVNETRFHNNLYLAGNYAEHHDLNIQSDPKKSGLMPYQYEYDKSLKVYSITIDLDMVGVDKNFNAEALPEEKADRVHGILDGIESLSLVVKGNMDNAEPIFVVGGLSARKTHYFENVVRIEEDKLILSEDLTDKLNQGFQSGLQRGNILANQREIEVTLKPLSIVKFFEELKQQVSSYYGV